MKKIITIILLLLVLLVVSSQAQAASQPSRGTIAYCKIKAEGVAERACIVRIIFHPVGQARKAVRVAWCESRLDPRASNGQYKGIFQMGASERKRFGHGVTVETQAKAALEYWKISGWSPWSCA